jgi:hypothetical protein
VLIKGSTHGGYGARYGLTTSQAIAANNGNATDQLLWGIGYTAIRHRSPSVARAFHMAHGWY